MRSVFDNCTGCRTCEQKCPKHCISMQPDPDGFLQAVIQERSCIHCNLCRKICPGLNAPPSIKDIHKEFFAVKKASYNPPNRFPSSSAGIFPVLAGKILQDGGAVFGARFDSALNLHTCRADNLEDLIPLCGSKYVQSDTGDSFAQVKDLLQQSHPVLYSGTPCQIAGLKAYLGGDAANLLTCDFICHGVPSPLLFRQYLDWLEKKYRIKVISYLFRLQDGTQSYWFQVTGEDNRENPVTVKQNGCLDPYYSAFLQRNSLRTSCYRCRFSGMDRVSDLTLADFWSIEKYLPEFADGSRISWLMINTSKGLQAWNMVKNLFETKPLTDSYALAEKKLELRNEPTQQQKFFYEKIRKDGFSSYAEEFRHSKVYVKEKLKEKLPVQLLKTVKKIKGAM